jgi:hypothetical protein
MMDSGSRCPKADDMHDALVAYLYADGDDTGVEADEAGLREHHRVAVHIAECAVCMAELESLRAVRDALGEWSPPEPQSRLRVVTAVDPTRGRPQWRQWLGAGGALGVAASVVLVVGLAFAGVEVRYDAKGVVIRIGPTSDTVEAVSPPSTEATMRPAGSNTSAPVSTGPTLPAGAGRERAVVTEGVRRLAPGDLLFDTTAIDRLQGLIDENERRHQQELALWLTDFAREFDMQRLADQRRVHDELGALEQYADYLVRASDEGR